MRLVCICIGVIPSERLQCSNSSTNLMHGASALWCMFVCTVYDQEEKDEEGLLLLMAGCVYGS
jgi:hypothetical protein